MHSLSVSEKNAEEPSSSSQKQSTRKNIVNCDGFSQCCGAKNHMYADYQPWTTLLKCAKNTMNPLLVLDSAITLLVCILRWNLMCHTSLIDIQTWKHEGIYQDFRTQLDKRKGLSLCLELFFGVKFHTSQVCT